MGWWSPFSREKNSQPHTEESTAHSAEAASPEPPADDPAALVPILWLLGKAQSGKSTIVRYLTGAEKAVVGDGFRPQTKASFLFDFPNSSQPLMRFLDTRGLGEVHYDPSEDLDRFNGETDLIVVVVKALDHALEPILEPLRRIRTAKTQRPVLLVLTCLHEAYPGEPHPDRYPFSDQANAPTDLSQPMPEVPDDLRRSLQTQLERFDGLFDAWVPIDITPEEEGYKPPDYGGEALKGAILKLLPSAYGHSLAVYLEDPARGDAAFLRIMVAANAAALASLSPIPWTDLPFLTAIQIGMTINLASLYGKPLSIDDSKNLIWRIGGAIAIRQGARELLKIIPVVGSILNAAFAFSVTFALGKTLCWYFEKRDRPTNAELEQQFAKQLKEARTLWKTSRASSPA